MVRLLPWRCLFAAAALVNCGGDARSVAHPPAEPLPAPECTQDDDCPSAGLCEVSRCREGRCEVVEAPPGTRCPMTREWAQRQADLYVVEHKELGVCWERSCIPRVYCAQKCGVELAREVEPMVHKQPCFEASCERAPVNERAVDVAYEGLRHCALACGYPMVRPPPVKRVPRPKPPPRFNRTFDGDDSAGGAGGY